MTRQGTHHRIDATEGGYRGRRPGADQPEEATVQQSDSSTVPTSRERPAVSDAIRMQILATEHWSLLATRGMTWNETFSRASMYLTVLSAAVVALALVAQATDFGANFRLFAPLLLPLVLVVGVGTQIRLGDARGEDVVYVIGMNRLRRAYLDLAPDLEPYFVTGRHDDEASIALTYVTPDANVTLGRVLSGSPITVGILNAVVAGVLAAFIVEAFGGATGFYVDAGFVCGLAYLGAFAALPVRQIARLRRELQPRFPHQAPAATVAGLGSPD